MCGRYGFSIKDARDVIRHYQLINTVDELARLESRYNIAPGQINPVVVQTSEGYKLGRFFWGLIPSWSKDQSFKFKTINARAEGIEQKATYRKPFRHQRCLIPATQFYEWDKSVKPSQPMLFKMKDDSLFSFAGLYDKWHDPAANKDIYSYTIITTEPNELIATVHNRMPVILAGEDEKEWLNPDYTEPEQLLPFLKPFPADNMEAYPISTAINIPGNEDASVAQPLNSK